LRRGIQKTALLSALALLAPCGCSGDETDVGTGGDAGSDTDADTDSDVDTEPSTDPDDDNDGDGLSNGLEEEIGTDPNLIDSDGDGYSDFIEYVAGTDPLDPGSNPIAEGDFIFISPYAWQPSPDLAVLGFISGDASMDLSTQLRDDETDDEDATALIERISPNTEGGAADPMNPGLICASGLATADDDDDSVPDRFVDVPPGTTVCFDIVPASNQTVPPSGSPAVYKAFLDVVGDGASVLDTRTIYFYVPD